MASAAPVPVVPRLPSGLARGAIGAIGAVTATAVTVFVLATALAPRDEPVWALDVLCYFAAGVGCALLVLLRGLLVREGRTGWLLLGTGLAAFTAGDVVFQFVLAAGEPPPVTLADVGFLAMYPCAMLGLVALASPHVRASPRSVRLDGLLVALGAATAVALLALGPVWEASRDLPAGQLAVSLAYPVCDLVIIGAAAGLLMVLRRRARARWLLLLTGVACFALGDTLFVHASATGAYREGGLLDTTWPLGELLLAAAAWLPPRRRTIDAPDQGLLLAPMAIAVAATALLVAHPGGPAGAVTTALAAATILAALFRVTVTVREAETLAVARHEASTDPLTGLANRRRLQAVLAEATADGWGRVSLLLFDLDRFKEVNDALGHHAGDLLLRTVAARLHEELDDDALLARLGGDEFAVVLPEVAAGPARERALRLADAIGRPIRLDGIDLAAGASVGVASCPEHGVDPEALLRGADAAMYRAKREGARVAVFDHRDAEVGRARLRTLGELRDGLRDGQVSCDLQPQVRADGTPRGMEALVRWDHPARGRLGPGSFLAVAEEAGLLREVTDRVLDVALAARAAWPGGRLRVAVNLAAVDLLDRRLADRVDAALGRHGLTGEALELEVTEDHVVVDPPRVAAALETLRARGISIALDDFGTGHSSLAYLQQLPLDTLKLARPIATAVDGEPRSRAIVEASVGLGRALGLTVIAEGVEDARTATSLCELGVDAIQGFHTGRPMPVHHAAAWMAAAPPPALRSA